MNENRTIFRRAKDKENPFVMIDKTIFEDEAISWKAKGLMGYLLSRPDDWVVRMADLKKRSTDGRHATRTAVQELEGAGYLTRYRERDEQGQFVRFVVEVHEVPVPEEQRTSSIAFEHPQSGFPTVDNPTVENQPYTYIDCTETDMSISILASANREPTPKGEAEEEVAFWKSLEEEAQFEEANRWRIPSTIIEKDALDAVGRTVYDDKAEYEAMQKVVEKVQTYQLPEKFWKSRLWNARKHKWGLATLIKSALSKRSLTTWQKNPKNNSHGDTSRT